MELRRGFEEGQSLKQRLAEEGESLRKKAQNTSPGLEREQMISQARQAEIGSKISEWLNSPGVRSGK